ncbi:MAG: prepilin-type N-terminal cleavage/methylation domain-containing protein [Gammaproteobacteria bacterium]|nr:MAG: prepilin-type N-terminal cleavage/methylation domain-containing protein [Gammaproteobacteria bacterium]
MKNFAQRGFTILELMITVLMLGVMLTLAVPSFSAVFKQNRLAAQTNSLLSSLNYARGQTINQNQIVIVQPITAGTDWSAGWKVRVNGVDIQFFEGVENASLISTAATITYQSDGTLTTGANVTLTLTLTPNDCPTGSSDVRVITITLSGQSSSTTAVCT